MALAAGGSETNPAARSIEDLKEPRSGNLALVPAGSAQNDPVEERALQDGADGDGGRPWRYKSPRH
jgi:hypothetical protein